MAEQNQGILLVNKSSGNTSFFLVNILRRITKIKKIGHAGTLDPFANGLMVMLLGKNYTKKSLNFIKEDKQYISKIHLGYTTKSFDPEEKLNFVSDRKPTELEIIEVLKDFQGNISQIPPMYSAKKVNGQKLCDLARKDITIERKPINIHVVAKLIKYSYPYLELDISCSSGTYIRTLANDIGEKLKTGAYLKELTRVRCGNFSLHNAIDQNLLEKGIDLNPYLIK